jgi:hypothetical protein
MGISHDEMYGNLYMEGPFPLVVNTFLQRKLLSQLWIKTNK